MASPFKAAGGRDFLPVSDEDAWLKAATDAAPRPVLSGQEPVGGRPKETFSRPADRHDDAESRAIQSPDAWGQESELGEREGVGGQEDRRNQGQADRGVNQNVNAVSSSLVLQPVPQTEEEDENALLLSEGTVFIPSNELPQPGEGQTAGTADEARRQPARPTAREIPVPRDHRALNYGKNVDDKRDISAGNLPKDGDTRQAPKWTPHDGALSKIQGDSRPNSATTATGSLVHATPPASAAPPARELKVPSAPAMSSHPVAGTVVAAGSVMVPARDDHVTLPGPPDRGAPIAAAQATTNLSPAMTSSPAVVAGQPPGPDSEVDPSSQPDQPSLRRAATDLAGMGGGAVSVTLRPPTLGFVRLQMAVGPTGATHIQLIASTQGGYSALTAAAPGLAQHLANAGITIGSLRTAMQGDSGHGQSQQERRSDGGAPREREPLKDERDEQVLGYA